VVEDGLFNVTKNISEANGSGEVTMYAQGDAFGEQNMLLKATDKSMTVECFQTGTLWKINRQTFR
jgi:CRP-like cAMP-binding protein